MFTYKGWNDITKGILIPKIRFPFIKQANMYKTNNPYKIVAIKEAGPAFKFENKVSSKLKAGWLLK